MSARALLDYVLPWIVDHPEDVEITEVTEGEGVVYELAVHPEDMGKVIGRRGRIIRSLRAVAKAAGQEGGHTVSVEVVD